MGKSFKCLLIFDKFIVGPFPDDYNFAASRDVAAPAAGPGDGEMSGKLTQQVEFRSLS